MAATQTVPQHFNPAFRFQSFATRSHNSLSATGIKVNVDRGHLSIQDGIGAAGAKYAFRA